MKSRLIIFFLIILLALTPTLPASAQQPIYMLADPPDSTRFPEVSLRLNVWDENGLPVSNLQAQDFFLQEDSGTEFHPSTVEEDLKANLEVMLVMDVSESMSYQPLTDARAAAIRFLDRLTPGDKAGMIAFSSGVDPAQLNPEREFALSEDLQPLYEALDALTAEGKTELYRAVIKAIDLMGDNNTGHQVILVLSDGRDESGDAPDEMLEAAVNANIPVFVIGLGGFIDEATLRQLTDATGGLYRQAPNSGQLAEIFNQMAALFKTQYVLKYTSTLAPDGDTHNVSVTLNKDGRTSNIALTLGPLPAAPTATVTSTSTPEPTPPPPTQTPSPVPTHTPTVTAVPVIEPTEPAGVLAGLTASQLFWPIVVGVLLLLGIAAAAIVMALRRRKPIEEVCARCGYDLTNHVGACPSCGETRRLKKVSK